MALGELLAVCPQNHGDVGELGHRIAQRLIDHHLARGVRQVVVAADYMGDAHERIVHHGGEVVGGGAIAAHDDKVVQLAGVKGHIPMDSVVHHHVAAILGHLDAQHVGLSRLHTSASLSGIDIPAPALVALEGILARLGCLAVCFQLIRRTKARVGFALIQQLLGGLAIDIQALSLFVGSAGAAHLRTLVPVQAQPAHGAQDDALVLAGRACGISVVDTQDKGAAVSPGKRPVINGSTGAAYMKLAGRGRRKTHAHGCIAQNNSSQAKTQPLV